VLRTGGKGDTSPPIGCCRAPESYHRRTCRNRSSSSICSAVERWRGAVERWESYRALTC
jgi:hypothetical protein